MQIGSLAKAAFFADVQRMNALIKRLMDEFMPTSKMTDLARLRVQGHPL